jgi:hypothetical protein
MSAEDGSAGNASEPSPLRPYLSLPGDGPAWDEPAAANPSFSKHARETTHRFTAGSAARLPPYLMTGGRARPIDEGLELEAQVVATGAGRGDLDQLSFESRDIVALCAHPLAVAEIASRLALQVGVTRVLVSDLVTTGHLAIRRPRLDVADRTDLMDRVIQGLQEIP